MWEVHDGLVDPFEGGYSAYVLQRVERDRVAQVTEQKRKNLMRKGARMAFSCGASRPFHQAEVPYGAGPGAYRRRAARAQYARAAGHGYAAPGQAVR